MPNLPKTVLSDNEESLGKYNSYRNHQEVEKPVDIILTLLGQSLPYLYMQL